MQITLKKYCNSRNLQCFIKNQLLPQFCDQICILTALYLFFYQVVYSNYKLFCFLFKFPNLSIPSFICKKSYIESHIKFKYQTDLSTAISRGWG